MRDFELNCMFVIIINWLILRCKPEWEILIITRKLCIHVAGAFVMYINLLPQMIVLSDWDFDRAVLCWSLIGSKNVL